MLEEKNEVSNANSHLTREAAKSATLDVVEVNTTQYLPSLTVEKSAIALQNTIDGLHSSL